MTVMPTPTATMPATAIPVTTTGMPATARAMPAATAPITATAGMSATATETTLGVLLLTGWRPKLVGAATCLVLTVFGTAMAVSLGIESPLSYSVFSAASAAAAYAVLGTSPNATPKGSS